MYHFKNTKSKMYVWIWGLDNFYDCKCQLMFHRKKENFVSENLINLFWWRSQVCLQKHETVIRIIPHFVSFFTQNMLVMFTICPEFGNNANRIKNPKKLVLWIKNTKIFIRSLFGWPNGAFYSRVDSSFYFLLREKLNLPWTSAKHLTKPQT